MTGLLSLPDAKAVPPALYLVLCDALEKDRANEAGFTQKDLDDSFRLWLKDRAEAKSDLKLTARDILAPAVPKKKIAPSPIEKQALALIGVIEPQMVQEQEESEEIEVVEYEEIENEFTEEYEGELEGFEFAEFEDESALREGLLEYAAGEHAGKAVAALLLAEEIAPSSELAAQSCDILLDKYGTQAVSADEKHMVLAGVAATSTADDRKDFRNKFSVLAAQESDADKTLKQKLFVLSEERDVSKLLIRSLGVNMGDVAMREPLPRNEAILSKAKTSLTINLT